MVVYGTERCGYCRAAEELLRRRGIAFEPIDVTGDDARRGWLVERTTFRTVPQIFIDGEPIGGYEELAALDRKGEFALRGLVSA